MIIRVQAQDIEAVSVAADPRDANPILRSIRRATANDPITCSYQWVIGKMPVFDEESHRTGRHMPQLYVVSQSNPLTADFYVLPPLAQAFLHQWFAGDPVTPIEFELPLQATTAGERGKIFGLPATLLEGVNANWSRLAQEANRELDVDTLKRGLSKLVQEGNKEVDLQPVKASVSKLVEGANKEIDLKPIKESVARLNAYGQTPVSSIGREIGRLLITPL